MMSLTLSGIQSGEGEGEGGGEGADDMCVISNFSRNRLPFDLTYHFFNRLPQDR